MSSIAPLDDLDLAAFDFTYNYDSTASANTRSTLSVSTQSGGLARLRGANSWGLYGWMPVNTVGKFWDRIQSTYCAQGTILTT